MLSTEESHMRRALVLSFLMCAVCSVAFADHKFVLKDYLHHAWANEFVSYEVDGSIVPKEATLLGPDGKAVPVQIAPRPGGKVEVAFIVEKLPADGEIAYILKSGKALAGSLVRKAGCIR